MIKFTKVILPIAIVICGCFLFLKKLPELGSTYDESFSYITNSMYLVRNLKWDQPYINLHPPLMYLLHGWPFIFFNTVNQTQNLIIARLSGLPFFIFFGIFIYWFVRKISGNNNAILALILYFFNIEILAHSRLATADFIQSVTITITVVTFHNFLKNNSKKNTFILGISLALALLSKHSALILILCFVLIQVAFLFRAKNSGIHAGDEASSQTRQATFDVANLEARKRKPRPLGRGNLFLKKIQVNNMKRFLIALLIAVVGLHAGYFFKESGKIPKNLESEKIVLFEKTNFLRPFLFIFPGAYLQGVDTQLKASQSVWWGYFNGKQYLTGLWYFYFAAFILKTQIPFLLILIIAIASFLKKRELDDLDLILIITISAFLVYFSFFNKLIIGLRYILPIYPLLLILISKNLKLPAKASKFNIIIAILLFTYTLQAFQTSGHFIEYTNEFTGGSKNAYKYFADSNLDWNQNQYAFEKYLKTHPEIIAVNPRKPTAGIIAVNVNEMNLYYYNDYQWLRKLNKDPIDNVSYTWLIYRIDSKEVN